MRRSDRLGDRGRRWLRRRSRRVRWLRRGRRRVWRRRRKGDADRRRREPRHRTPRRGRRVRLRLDALLADVPARNGCGCATGALCMCTEPRSQLRVRHGLRAPRREEHGRRDAAVLRGCRRCLGRGLGRRGPLLREDVLVLRRRLRLRSRWCLRLLRSPPRRPRAAVMLAAETPSFVPLVPLPTKRRGYCMGDRLLHREGRVHDGCAVLSLPFPGGERPT